MDRATIKQIFFSPPVIYTDRLILRPILPRDARDMFEYSRDPEVTKYLTWEPHTNVRYTKRHIERIGEAYREGIFYDWALELKDGGKMIGTCGFTSFSFNDASCEIGYVLNPKYHGMDLATEAAERVIRFAFERLSASSVCARCMKDNIASRRVMEKCGMVYQRDVEHTVIKQKRYVTVSQYSITSDEYLSAQHK